MYNCFNSFLMDKIQRYLIRILTPRLKLFPLFKFHNIVEGHVYILSISYFKKSTKNVKPSFEDLCAKEYSK